MTIDDTESQRLGFPSSVVCDVVDTESRRFGFSSSVLVVCDVVVRRLVSSSSSPGGIERRRLLFNYVFDLRRTSTPRLRIGRAHLRIRRAHAMDCGMRSRVETALRRALAPHTFGTPPSRALVLCACVRAERLPLRTARDAHSASVLRAPREPGPPFARRAPRRVFPFALTISRAVSVGRNAGRLHTDRSRSWFSRFRHALASTKRCDDPVAWVRIRVCAATKETMKTISASARVFPGHRR